MEDVILGTLPSSFDSLWMTVNVIVSQLPAWFGAAFGW